MFDQAQRSIWLEDMLWHKLKDSFPTLRTLPTEVLITVGYPSSGARGRSDKIKPAEVNYNWHGNPNEKAFISIHPLYFDSVENAMKAVLFAASKFTGGARWGARNVGMTKESDGTLTVSAETAAILEKLKADIGEPPSGFGVAFPVRAVSRARLRKYVNATKLCAPDSNGNDVPHPVIRAASDTLQVKCNSCGNDYSLVK